MAAFKIGQKVKARNGVNKGDLKAGVVYTVVDVKYLKDKDLHVHGLQTKEGVAVERRWSDKFIQAIIVDDPFEGNF